MEIVVTPLDAWQAIVTEVLGGRDATAAARFGNARLVASLAALLRAFPGPHRVDWVVADDARVAGWVTPEEGPTYAIALELTRDRVVDFHVLVGTGPLSLAKI